MGERMGVVAYAFLANSRLTKNRPADEHRFQIKYGPDDKREPWQDPFRLYTTLLAGLDLVDARSAATTPRSEARRRVHAAAGRGQRG
jgi:hypothetical protein